MRVRSTVPFVLVLCALMLARAPRLQAGVPGAAVATENATATRDALAILDAGGSAADAAIVAALVAGVTAPTSSGLGGGGFAMFWDEKAQKMSVLDFRERAPRAISPAEFENRPLPPGEEGRLVGTPSELAGLIELHRRAGKLPFSALVKKAEARARNGFVVSQHLAAMLGYGEKKLARSPQLKSLFFPKGKAAVVGQRVVNTELAETLARIAREGGSVMTEGPLALQMVEATQAAAGALTLEDLAEYRVVEREPLRIRYDGKDVYTMPPPSAGGLMVAELLMMFSPDELRTLGFGTPAYQHLLAEGMRGAIADRMRYIGDPDIEKVDLQALMDERRLAARKAKIALDRTHALPLFGQEEHGTHHLVTSDRSGNVVSLTTTVNRLFGSTLVTASGGVVLNDQLDDFTKQADVLPFGMKESPNRPRPLARPVSSMTPTIVIEGGQAVLALGGSGGMTIPTNVSQVLLGCLVFGQTPDQAVRAPRILIPLGPDTIMVDPGTPEQHKEDLAFRGERVAEARFRSHAVQVLSRRDGVVRAASDPRKFGEALVH